MVSRKNCWGNLALSSDAVPDANPFYGKCPKISNIKVSNKIANENSVDPDQAAPKEQSDHGLHCLTVHLLHVL